jgi:hypothetical protein
MGFYPPAIARRKAGTVILCQAKTWSYQVKESIARYGFHLGVLASDKVI